MIGYFLINQKLVICQKKSNICQMNNEEVNKWPFLIIKA